MFKNLLIIICLLFAFSGRAQTEQQKLERRKAQIQKEIVENEKQLREARTKERSANLEIEAQNKKIKLTEQLIRTNSHQVRLLNDDLYRTQLNINELRRELKTLKDDYAEMIRKSYKSRSMQSRAMFLLSSENFLQAYKRAQYMKQYASYRKAQGDEIKKKTDQLTEYTAHIEKQKAAQEKLLAENEKERLELLKVKHAQEVLVGSLKKDQRKLAAEIRKKQQENRNIDRRIDELIKRAIAEANRKAAAEAARKNPAAASEIRKKAAAAPDKIVLTPEGKIIADNFRGNKGKLGWPVERGVVSLGYGKGIPHPVHRSLEVNNSGIEITTEPGAQARAVFGGEVFSILQISPINHAVILIHGDYLTIYQNLINVSVSKGDKVSVNQPLGRIRTTSESGRTVLKFLIKHNNVYENPQTWLAKM